MVMPITQMNLLDFADRVFFRLVLKLFAEGGNLTRILLQIYVGIEWCGPVEESDDRGSRKDNV